MSGFGTAYTETEALLYAQADRESDQDAEATTSYLLANFLPGELQSLKLDALFLAHQCSEIAHKVAARAAVVPGAPADGNT